MKDLIQSVISMSSLYYEGVYDDEMLRFSISNLQLNVEDTYLTDKDINDIMNQIKKSKNDIVRKSN